MKNKIFVSALILLLPILFTLLSGCNNEIKENADETYLNLISEWDNNRVENLKDKKGWLNLAGLFWLKNGENKFGSNKNNDIVFPSGKADDFIGSFFLDNGNVTLKILEGVEVFSDDTLVTEIIVTPDTAQVTTIMNHKSLSWHVIIRDDKIGIRLRDFESELVKTFEGVERFPVDTLWRITAKYVAFETPQKIVVPNILGSFTEDESPGKIVFTKGGKNFTLLPILAGENYFIIFADETSGIESYGAGRFLYAGVQNENNNVILDFNKAYNPPCAFTKYATCPLPPKENYISLAVTAGEKNWGNH